MRVAEASLTLASISVDDVSPNDANGARLSMNSAPTGVIKGLVGDDHALYAVSANAGIWKSVDGGAWQQLPNSPAHAYCIAQDPHDASHLIVGERRTEAIKRQFVGVWESRDAGATWSYVLDPSTAPGSTSQASAAAMFSAKSTAFAAGAGGIGRKAVGRASFSFASSPAGHKAGEHFTAFARSESNEVFLEERLAGISATGDVLLYYWTPKLNWRVTNLTTATGVRAASALTIWQTPNGPYTVEHLAFTDPTGHVIVLYSSERADWQVVDVTAKTGQAVQGPLTSWQTPNGPYNVEHLAGVNAAGEVIVFWWSPAHDWQAVNVTAKTGQRVSTALTSWQTPNGPYNVEHLAGVNAAGEVIVFWWSSIHDWEAVNVSLKTGQRVSTALTSWQTPNGPYNVEHLAGATAAGEVIVFVWSPAHDWQAIDVTAKTGQRSKGALTSWQTPNGPYNVEHLAGVDSAGEVIVFWWSPAHDWQAIDVSGLTGVRASGALASWQISKRLQFLWARTASQLFFSSDDGVSWSTHSFIPQIAIPETTVRDNTVPSGKLVVPAGTYDVEVDARPNGGDDRLGLAAVDSSFYVPSILYEPGRRDDDGRPAKNHNTVLIGELLADQWAVQILETGNGTGLGGRRFLKSYIVDSPGAPGSAFGRAYLFDCSADEVLVAAEVRDGSIEWSLLASTFVGARASDRIHSDIWDFHFSPDGRVAWVACDGGVFRAEISTLGWRELNDGLHVHHVHTLTVLPVGGGQRSKLVYPTSDNDGWYRGASALGDPPPAWRNTSSLGDANWTAGDAGNPAIAIIARRIDLATLVAFGAPPPPGASFTEGAGIAIKNDGSFDGPLGFQCIQTLKGESPAFPLLDAVMLVNLPLRDKNGNPVPGPLGQADPQGLPALVRSPRFAAAPAASSLFAGWSVEAKHLPAGTRGFWVAGGHANPVYYAYAPLAGSLTLFKRKAGNVWNPLPLTGLLDGGLFGPCFVNPYDANVIYALTASGVQVSRDGGASFSPDAVLTGLISGNGTYPISGRANVASAFQEIGGRSHSAFPGTMATLSHMAFLADDPRVAVAASPFTGVFYFDGAAWRDLSGSLPKPLAPVSAVGIDGRSIFVAFEGRSIVQLDGYNT